MREGLRLVSRCGLVKRCKTNNAVFAPDFLRRLFVLCSGMLRSGGVVKKQQGVIWGKTAASFEGHAARNVIARLADYMELHSTIAPKEAPLRQAVCFRTDSQVFFVNGSQFSR